MTWLKRTAASDPTRRNAWLAGAPVAGSRFSGVVGAPAVFDRSRWEALSRLEGDQGAGRLLRAESVAAIDWEGGAIDVDTADDVRALGGQAPAELPSC